MEQPRRKRLSTRNDQVFMSGRIKELQQQKQTNSFTPYQNFLYKRAVEGLRVYTEEEVRAMNPGKRMRIDSRYKKAKRIMHSTIEKIVSVQIHLTLGKYANSNLVKTLMSVSYENEMIEFQIQRNRVRNYRKILLHLGLRDNQIIDLLIDAGTLPKEFYEIKYPKNEAERFNK